MNISEEKRVEFAKRLKDLAMHMYDAMSQGQHNTIFVTQEMADDVLAAAIFVNLSKGGSDKDPK